MIDIYVIGSKQNQFKPLDNIRTKFLVDEVHDGDNIDQLNPYYCELTGLYYLWKHSTADIKGLEHYRTYFIGNNGLLSEQEINDIMLNNEFICGRMHFPTIMHFNTVLDGVLSGPTKSFVSAFTDSLYEIHPSLKKAYEYYVNQSWFYLTNTLIANTRVFNEYCRILFMVLDVFCKKVGYTPNTARMAGYMGEIFMGVWLTITGIKPYICNMIKYEKNLQDIIYKI